MTRTQPAARDQGGSTMIGQTIQNAINMQIQAEMNSANLYLAMSVYCSTKNLQGFGHWLRVQSNEEREHAMKMIDHVLARGGQVEIKTIEAPPKEFGSIVSVFESVLKHEKLITERVHRLYEAAATEKDLATQTFLQWFIAEQVEEEATATEIVEKLRMLGDKTSAVLYLDKEYGKRGG